MGDRANIVMRFDDGGVVYFYTHWAGSELAETLKAALQRGKPRWNDQSYLARIIFSEMIQDSVMDETGYGISTAIGDGDDRLIHVDTAKQTVALGDRAPIAYEDYCKLTEPRI